jgi:outer membrane protein OmpA-like peptidoglycan-associated protein
MRAVTAIAVLAATAAHADPTSGVDVALFRSSYDTNGIFSVEGARLLPRHDFSFKALVGYGKSPIDLAVPGIGDAADDTAKDSVLGYLVTLDIAFAMSLHKRIAVGFDVGVYRTTAAVGYGARGRYSAGTATPSTGLISLRGLSNIDPSASPSDSTAYLGDEIAGPLDARAGLKLALVSTDHVALSAIGSVFLPFGEDQMLLGDRGLVFEPKLAGEIRVAPASQTRLVGNVGARLRERTVLQAYDTANTMATPDDAKVFFDLGSELVAGLGGAVEIAPRIVAAAEAQVFVPLPNGLSYGRCRLHDGRACNALVDADYWPSAKHGDLTALGAAGMLLRVSPDLVANVTFSSGQLGARGDDFRITTGLVWQPRPSGASVGRSDRDDDGIEDSIDGCPNEGEDRDNLHDDDGCPDVDNDDDGLRDIDDQCPNEPEDKDSNRDDDGCPEADNDNDGVFDAADKCAIEAEDRDGFEDDDGCPDHDNDGDGIPDGRDQCANDAEKVNAFEDDDGCPDVHTATGPQERPDGIDLVGQQITFDRSGKLTPETKHVLGQVAALIKSRGLTIRVEIHVPLGTTSARASRIAAQKRKDNRVAQQRAAAVAEFLASQGLTQQQVQVVAIGSARPLATVTPTDRRNERVDFVKAQQGGAP